MKRGKEKKSKGSDQRGSVLTITLLVILAITILGLMSIRTSIVELQIAGNEKQLKESFYLAEAAAVEGIHRLFQTPSIDLNEHGPGWHHSKHHIDTLSVDFRDPLDWDVDQKEPDNGIPANVGEDTYITAVEWQIAAGSSLISTESRLYVNRIYGLCTKNHTDTLIEIGYKSRY
jgi:hypothetical protein